MTLPSSGGLSFAQILAEIGDSFPVTIPNANWRILAKKPTGSLIIPTDFYGKSWPAITLADTKTTPNASSFSSVNFGATDTNRWIAIFLAIEDTASNPGDTPTMTGFTRIAASSTGNGSNTANGVALFVGQPSGTSGTVSFNWSSTPCTITVLRVTGYDLSSAYDSKANGDLGGGTYDIDIPTDGALIAMVTRDSLGTDVTFSGITERGNDASPDHRREWAWDILMALETNRTVSYSPFSASQGLNAWAIASFPRL